MGNPNPPRGVNKKNRPRIGVRSSQAKNFAPGVKNKMSIQNSSSASTQKLEGVNQKNQGISLSDVIHEYSECRKVRLGVDRDRLAWLKGCE